MNPMQTTFNAYGVYE